MVVNTEKEIITDLLLLVNARIADVRRDGFGEVLIRIRHGKVKEVTMSLQHYTKVEKWEEK